MPPGARARRATDVRGGPAVLRSDLRMRVHGQREIAMDEIHFSSADVIVHNLAIGGQVERFAGRALKVAKNLHDDGGVLGAGGVVGIDVGDPGRGLGSDRSEQENETAGQDHDQ